MHMDQEKHERDGPSPGMVAPVALSGAVQPFSAILDALPAVEQRVYEIARDLMARHYVLELNALHSEATRVLKADTRASIANAIQW
jgi:hypothetical protein